MKTNILFILLFPFAISCNPVEEEPTEEIITEKPMSLYDLEEQFKYHDLTDFDIDTFDWETRPGNYNELDSTTYKLVWQNIEKPTIGTGYDREYLYSWQNRDTNFIEFTLLSQDEGSYCDVLTYCIFDKNGKKIDNFMLSASCGDGGWMFTSNGKFINKTTFEQLAVESEMAGFDSLDADIEIYEGDSTLTHYTIGTDGKVNSKEIYKRHFSSKYEDLYPNLQ